MADKLLKDLVIDRNDPADEKDNRLAMKASKQCSSYV